MNWSFRGILAQRIDNYWVFYMKENIYIIRRNWMKEIGFKEHIKGKTTSRNTKESSRTTTWVFCLIRTQLLTARFKSLVVLPLAISRTLPRALRLSLKSNVELMVFCRACAIWMQHLAGAAHFTSFLSWQACAPVFPLFPRNASATDQGRGRPGVRQG